MRGSVRSISGTVSQGLVPTTPTSPGSSRSRATTCARRSRPCTASRTTLARGGDLEPPDDRYVEMIDAASAQLAELLDELSLAARIADGPLRPDAARGGHARAGAGGRGAARRGPRRASPAPARRVETTRTPSSAGSRRSPSRRCATAVSTSVEVEVDGAELRLSPVTPASAPVVLGDDLRDLGAAVAVRLVRRLGGSVAVDGETLAIRLA